MMSGKIKIGKRKNAKHGQVKMNGKILSLFLYILLYAFCVVSGVLSAQEERYTYTVGSICQETITANKDLVDEYSTEILREEAMQKVMDEYAGGISTHYQFNEKQLALAKEKIEKIEKLAENVNAGDMHELMFVYELKERLTVCKSVIAHLFARKETRWHSFDENLDYPKKSGDWLKYVNSKMEDGKITVFTRKLVGREEHYEHHDESGAL